MSVDDIDPMKTPPKGSRTSVATAATVEKVMRSVNVVLSKSEKLDRYASSAAKQAHSLVEAHVPVVLQYLPDNKVNKEFVFVLSVTAAIIALFLIGAGNLLLDLTGVMYPMYATILAVESPEKEDDKQWLAYWLIFCFLKVTERIFFPILRLIPMFPFAKMFFLVWLYHPVFMGAKVVYGLSRPALLGLVSCVDPLFARLHGTSFEAGSSGERRTAGADKDCSDSDKSGSIRKSNSKRSSMEGFRRTSPAADKENVGDKGRNSSGMVKQLHVVVQTLSLTRDRDEACSANPTLVQLKVVPAAGKESVGLMDTPFKTNFKHMDEDGSISFTHPLSFVDLGEDVQGCRLQVEIRQKSTFDGIITVANGSLDLANMEGKKGSVEHTMTHHVEVERYSITLETTLKTVADE
jgi:hypothetical protein